MIFPLDPWIFVILGCICITFCGIVRKMIQAWKQDEIIPRVSRLGCEKK